MFKGQHLLKWVKIYAKYTINPQKLPKWLKFTKYGKTLFPILSVIKNIGHESNMT